MTEFPNLKKHIENLEWIERAYELNNMKSNEGSDKERIDDACLAGFIDEKERDAMHEVRKARNEEVHQVQQNDYPMEKMKPHFIDD